VLFVFLSRNLISVLSEICYLHFSGAPRVNLTKNCYLCRSEIRPSGGDVRLDTRFRTKIMLNSVISRTAREAREMKSQRSNEGYR